ncbi:MAG: LamG domain-containing protein [Mesorhizobium sp.]|nr:MAG: LamG domain-containing protein [Mesorhizobium sp.]
MASIFNEQRVLGVRIVADGTTMYNGLPVIGLYDAGAVLFGNNLRTLSVNVISTADAMYNDQPVRGAVVISDGRKMYKNQPVIPVSGIVSDASLFANGEDGFLFNFSQTGLLFQNSNGTTPVAADSDPIGWAKSPVASQRIATQDTASARPFWKTPNFARLDGADDNWLTTLNPSAAMSLFSRINMPAAPSTTHIIAGAQVSVDRLYYGITAAGKLGGSVGVNVTNTIVGTNDLRGRKLTVGMTFDGTTVKLFEDGVAVYSGGQNGVVGTAAPIRIGAGNQGGVASNFFPGDIFNALAINRALSPAEILSLTNYWNAQ